MKIELTDSQAVRLFKFVRMYPCTSVGVLQDVSNIHSMLKDEIKVEQLTEATVQLVCEDDTVVLELTRDEAKACAAIIKWAMSKEMVLADDAEHVLPLLKSLEE